MPTLGREARKAVCVCVALVMGTACGRVGLDVLRPGTESSEPSFGVDGRFVLDLGSADTATFTFQGVAEDHEGRLLIVGRASASTAVVVRVLDSGLLDTSFANGGYAYLDGIAVANGIAITDDAKIVVVGEYDATFDRGAVTRLNPDGSLDSDFGTDGVATVDASSDRELYNGVVVHPGGTIVIGGQAGHEGVWDAQLTQLTAAGDVDTTFQSAGSRRDDWSYGDEFLTMVGDTARRPHVVGQGYFSDRFACMVARYTIAGDADATFASGGIVRPSAADADESTCPALAFTASGDLLLAGRVTRVANTDAAMWRLDGAGNEAAGGVRVSARTGADEASSVVVLPDGRIVLGGTASTPTSGFLWVLDGSGVPDATVGTGGYVAIDLDAVTVRSLLVDHAGRVVVYGSLDRDGRQLALLTRVLL